MNYEIKKEGKFRYIEEGEGTPVVILHGLMGSLSNFDTVVEALRKNGYRAIIPSLPLYTISLLKASVRGLSSFIHQFIKYKQIEDFFPIPVFQNTKSIYVSKIAFLPDVQKNVRLNVTTE